MLLVCAVVLRPAPAVADAPLADAPAAATPAPVADVPLLGVRVTADSVVFRFIPSHYRMAVHGRTSKWTRLRDLAVREVTVAGPWNQWSTEAWPLHLVGRTWELRCPLSAVADRDTVSFKYVVNGEYWVQPPPDCVNQLNAGIGDTTMNMFFVRPRP
jgi:hypothetical protein